MALIRGLHIPKETDTENWIINSNFDFWQRGTSVDPAFGQYTADRWAPYETNGSVTVSRVTSGLSSPTGSSSAMRVLSNATDTFRSMATALEAADVDRMRGRYITYSVYLRRNASYSSGLSIAIAKNNTANVFSTGTWTNLGSLSIPNASLSSTVWTRFSVTAFVPDDGTVLGLRFTIGTGSASTTNGGYWEATQAMANFGTVAAPHELRMKSYQAELQLCQRYYEKSFDLDQTPTTSVAAGRIRFFNPNAATAFDTHHMLIFKAQKRTSPTMTQFQAVGGTANASFDNVGNHGGNMFISSLGPAATSFNHWTANAELA